MTILNFSYAIIKDEAAFQRYIHKAAILMEAANVEVVLRGKYVETKEGEPKPNHITAVFRYPDMAAARGFYSSDDYKALIPLRDQACDMTVHFYEE